MDPSKILEIFDEDDDKSSKGPAEDDIDRRAVLRPIITRVVDALGGYEGEEYQLGDELYGCLKDLKKLWRKDDTDDDRTVARIFHETLVLPNDLIPILLATAGKGLVEDKRAIACVDLMTAMTWPIDVAEELKELDEELDERADYTQLIGSHLQYKAALLKTPVMKALFGIVLPPLAKKPKEREERDGQIINVVLHLIRNLAFIKDLPPNSTRSTDNVELSSLQSRMIRILEETHILQLLLTIAANSDGDPLYNSWNTLVLEIFYLLFRGTKPETLAADHAKRPTANLQRLLAVEERNRRDLARKASSRHSRFGTTITVQLKKPAPTDDGERVSRPLVLHRQQGINGEAGSLLDMTKKQKSKKGNTVDELAREDNLSSEAMVALKQLASDFLEGCFNPFLAGLLKDIRAERAKITEKDNLRLLYVTKWFLEYFLTMRAKAQSTPANGNGELGEWSFGLIAEVIERVWIVWVLKRMREAMEEKPKLWTELQAGIECLTQLFLLIDAMSSSEVEDPTLSEAAELLLQQLIYNGEVLDISLNSLRFYKGGTQSLTYLDSGVYLAHSLLRMLEKWSKRSGDGTYVRQKLSKRKKHRRGSSAVPETEEDGILADAGEDGDRVDDEGVVQEVIFSFEALEMKFANSDITHTLLTYLARYKEFTSSEKMKRVVSLIHRQAVKAKAEGLFFQVSTLDLFKTVLNDQKSLPQEQPYKDLVNLINFILRRFFKAVEEEPFLTIEAFFPKNRGNWKQYSSWEPEKKEKRAGGPGSRGGRNAASNATAEVVVKKGYSLTDQIGIAIAALVDTDRKDLVVWTQDILRMAINKRKRIIDEVTDKSDDDVDPDTETPAEKYENISAEARERIMDEVIPCVTEDRAEAASKNKYLKLLFRLSKFTTRGHDEDDEEEELEWYIPSSLTPAELERTRNVIIQFLETPFDPSGKKIAELLRKKRRARRRRSPSASNGSDSGNEGRKTKKQRKEKEKEVYKSAQFIEDSDEEYGDMDAFLEKEKEQRDKMVAAAAAAGTSGGAAAGGQAIRPAGMRTTGTKKRKKRKAKGAEQEGSGDNDSALVPAQEWVEAEEAEPERLRLKPRLVTAKSKGSPITASSPVSPRAHSGSSRQKSVSSAPDEKENSDDDVEIVAEPIVKRRATKRLFLSDSEDDE